MRLLCDKHANEGVDAPRLSRFSWVRGYSESRYSCHIMVKELNSLSGLESYGAKPDYIGGLVRALLRLAFALPFAFLSGGVIGALMFFLPSLFSLGYIDVFATYTCTMQKFEASRFEIAGMGMILSAFFNLFIIGIVAIVHKELITMKGYIISGIGAGIIAVVSVFYSSRAWM